jgi:hypothetical protein
MEAASFFSLGMLWKEKDTADSVLKFAINQKRRRKSVFYLFSTNHSVYGNTSGPATKLICNEIDIECHFLLGKRIVSMYNKNCNQHCNN